MSIASVAGSVIGAVFGNPGDLAKEAMGLIKDYIPDPVQKAQAELQLQTLLATKQQAAEQADATATQQLNDRISAYEGTAKEIVAVPYIGPVLLMLRGAFRPIAGYSTLWMDWNVFSGSWDLSKMPDKITVAFWTVNILVLGFFFGERTVKNILPIVMDYLKAKLP